MVSKTMIRSSKSSAGEPVRCRLPTRKQSDERCPLVWVELFRVKQRVETVVHG